jgi:putative aldouronate transport system substrate-binding protein
MKKHLVLLAGLVLVTSFSFAGGGSQSSKGSGAPAEFSVTFLKNDWHGDPNDMEVFKKLERETNVKVNWQVYSNATWNERKNLMLSSGDIPDVFYMNAVNNNDLERYGPQGLFVDLTQLVQQHAPKLQAAFERVPAFKALCISPTDGKMYTISRAAERPANTLVGQMYFYKPWLDKLGLGIPGTHEEFYEVLKAFKTKDPNGNGKADELPFGFFNEGNNFLGQLFSRFGYGYGGGSSSSSGGFYTNVNDKAIFVPGTENYKEAIIYLHRLFAEGLLSAEDFATQDMKRLTANCNADPVIVGSFIVAYSSNLLPNEKLKDYVRLDVPLKGPHGDQIWVRTGSINNMGGTQFVMTNKAKDQVAIMRWLDAHFDPRNSIELFLGPVGTTLIDQNGFLANAPVPAGKSYSEFRFGNCPVHVPLIVTADDWGRIVQVMDEDAERIDWVNTTLKPYLTQKFVYSYPTADESRFELSRGKDISDYVKPLQAKWLIEGGIEQEWDAYLARLKNMGIDEYTRIIQTQIDRFNKFSQ